MDVRELHRGRLIDHVQMVVAGLEASRRFYEAILATLDVPVSGTADDHFWVDELVVSSAASAAAQGAAGLANGGRDNGAPGARSYHPGYQAAFLLDPDGNNVEAVHQGAAHRSAASVTIRF